MLPAPRQSRPPVRATALLRGANPAASSNPIFPFPHASPRADFFLPPAPAPPRSSIARMQPEIFSVRPEETGTTRAAAGGRQPHRLAPRPGCAPRPPAPLSHPPSYGRRPRRPRRRGSASRSAILPAPPRLRNVKKARRTAPESGGQAAGPRSLGDGSGEEGEGGRAAAAAPRAGTKGRARGPPPLPSVSQREGRSSYWKPPGCGGSRR